MGDNRKHRGQHPADSKLFDEKTVPIIRRAVVDMEWLLSHGYPERASLKLVGDRFRLQDRQRKAIFRTACSNQDLELRTKHQVHAEQVTGQTILLDGFNVLITVESALSDGFLFESRDGCYRDLASIHGSYKRVTETQEAILLIGEYLQEIGVQKATWYFDRPISNSGRLKTMLYQIADEKEWNWKIDLVYNPDKVLIAADEIVVSSDSIILNESKQWFNLAREVVDSYVSKARIIRLSKKKHL